MWKFCVLLEVDVSYREEALEDGAVLHEYYCCYYCYFNTILLLMRV